GSALRFAPWRPRRGRRLAGAVGVARDAAGLAERGLVGVELVGDGAEPLQPRELAQLELRLALAEFGRRDPRAAQPLELLVDGALDAVEVGAGRARHVDREHRPEPQRVLPGVDLGRD